MLLGLTVIPGKVQQAAALSFLTKCVWSHAYGYLGCHRISLTRQHRRSESRCRLSASGFPIWPRDGACLGCFQLVCGRKLPSEEAVGFWEHRSRGICWPLLSSSPHPTPSVCSFSQEKCGGGTLTRKLTSEGQWSAPGRTPTPATNSTKWKVISCGWTEPSRTPDMTSKY